jgi:ribonuclease D
MDFEGEFNLHCYGEKLCLIQIFDGKRFYVIDPFTISREELKKTLEGREIKLFYDASSDRMLVYKQYGIKITSILDLKILVDLLEFQHKGLCDILNNLLKIEIHKKKKFQRHNWTNRPVDEDAIKYALSDVENLFKLKDELLDRIKQQDMIEQLVYRLARTNINYDKISIPSIKKKKEYKTLSVVEKATCDKIYNMREALAKRLNRPPDNVFRNRQIFEIVRRQIAVTGLIYGKGLSASVKKEINEGLSKILD